MLYINIISSKTLTLKQKRSMYNKMSHVLKGHSEQVVLHVEDDQAIFCVEGEDCVICQIRLCPLIDNKDDLSEQLKCVIEEVTHLTKSQICMSLN